MTLRQLQRSQAPLTKHQGMCEFCRAKEKSQRDPSKTCPGSKEEYFTKGFASFMIIRIENGFLFKLPHKPLYYIDSTAVMPGMF